MLATGSGRGPRLEYFVSCWVVCARRRHIGGLSHAGGRPLLARLSSSWPPALRRPPRALILNPPRQLSLRCGIRALPAASLCHLYPQNLYSARLTRCLRPCSLCCSGLSVDRHRRSPSPLPHPSTTLPLHFPAHLDRPPDHNRSSCPGSLQKVHFGRVDPHCVHANHVQNSRIPTSRPSPIPLVARPPHPPLLVTPPQSPQAHPAMRLL